jgi:hypothetical protein
MDPSLLSSFGHRPGGAYPRRVDLNPNRMVLGWGLLLLLDEFPRHV